MSQRPNTILSVLFCLLIVTSKLVAGEIPRSGPAPAPQSPARIVPFDLYQGYCIVVRGSAGPLKHLNFILDTGTIHSTFNSRITGRLGLQNEVPAGIVTVAGREQAEDAVLPSLALGPVQWSNLEVTAADLSYLQKTLPFRVDAILGLDVLGSRPFVIDYSAHVLRFGPPPALAVSVPLRLEEGLAVFDAEIDQRPVHLLFDTGASALVLFKTDTPSDAAARASEGPGDFQSRQVRSLRVGSQEFLREPALLARNPKPSQIAFDGVMSPAALGIIRVSVDIEGGTLAFSR